jgi:hypothetical protein
MKMEATTKVKPDKKTEKEYKDATALIDLIDSGIPLHSAVFHRSILSHGGSQGGEPETGLYSPKNKGAAPKPSRTANLWYTPHGVVIEQKGRYKIIPLANVSDTNVL